MRITIIAAVAENGAIGFQNRLLYHLPADLKRFKLLTSGGTVIMGRRTFLSLPKGALPNRRNIVLSQSLTAVDGADVFPSLEAALSDCRMRAASDSPMSAEVFIIGGASVYRESLQFADRLCLTFIHDTPAQADTFFPVVDETWRETWREDHQQDERHAVAFSFVDFVRQQSCDTSAKC